jgi:hypothetical protein
MTESEISSAYIWAAKVHPDAVPIMALSKGDKFRWPGNDLCEKVYHGRGWCSSPLRVKKFRTSVKTAVLAINQNTISKGDDNGQ